MQPIEMLQRTTKISGSGDGFIEPHRRLGPDEGNGHAGNYGRLLT